MKEMKLGELLDKDELVDVELLIRENDWVNLRKYLNSIKDKLEKKGVVADYLYYVLEAQLKK